MMTCPTCNDQTGGCYDCSESAGPPPPRVRYVNAYEITLGYGGPEEGGWWFDRGTPLGSVPFTTPDEEQAARELLARTFEPDFDGRPDKSSVAGNAASLVIFAQDHIAEDYPSNRPHYE